jgi:hypothetical protein
VKSAVEWPVTAIDSSGRDRAAELFTMADGELRARRSWIPIMMTNDPFIATRDCLFYVVRRRAG